MSLQVTSSKQFFAAKRHAYRAHSCQPTLKRKLSISASDERVAKRLSMSNSCILVLPTEAIENICLLVDEPDDLQSLTHVSRLFASIACPVYTTRLGIRVTNTSRFVQIEGDSFRALAAWRRSRVFTCLRDKYLTCDFDDQNVELARSQIRALRNFLSTSFTGRPFVAVYMNSVDTLSPLEILQFIRLVDDVGCQTASISSGLGNPQWSDYSSNHTRILKLPTVSLSHLRSLDIDNQYFSPHQWTSLLSHLTGPGLEALFIRGQPTIHALSKFLSRHSNVSRLQFNPRWATHNQCISSSGCPQIIQMPQLSEIGGPPCHLRALLRRLSPTPAALTIKIGSDLALTYMQYVRAVLRSVSLCGPQVRLEIRLPSCYDLDHNMMLDRREMKSLSTIPLPEVASLEISFPSMSKGRLLACCAQWFSLMPTLRRIAVYVGSLKHRKEAKLSPDTVAGPCSGIVSYTSGKVVVEWNIDLE